MKENCSLCECEDDDASHLDLYVVGSEGIYVCLQCRLALTQCARGIRSAVTKSNMNLRKKLAGKKGDDTK